MNTRSSKERSLHKKRQIPKKRLNKSQRKSTPNKKSKKVILQKRKIIKKAPKKLKSKQTQSHKQVKRTRINTVISKNYGNTRSSSIRKSKRKISRSSTRQFVSNMIASSKLKCQTQRKIVLNKSKSQSKSKSKNKQKSNKVSVSSKKPEKIRSSSRIRKISQANFKIRIPTSIRPLSKDGKTSIRRNSEYKPSAQKSKNKEKRIEQKPKKVLRKDVKQGEDGDQILTTQQMHDESADKYKVIINKPIVMKEDKGKSILALQTEKKIESSRSFILSVQQKSKQWHIKISQLKKKGQIITINIQGIICSCINYRIHHACEHIQFLFDKVIRNPDLKEQILYRKYLGDLVFGKISEQLKIVLGFHFLEKTQLGEHPLPNACLICFEQLNSQTSLSCEQCERKFHKACHEYFKFNRNHCPTCKKSSIKLQNDETLRQMEKLTI